MSHQTARRVWILLAIAVGCATPAAGQTRAGEIAKEQEQKAQQSHPYHPNRAEVFFDQLEHGWWFIGIPRDWYSTLGNIYEGGGLAAGGGYRHYIGYDSFVDAGAKISLAGYKRIAITGFTPNHLGDRVDLTGTIAWLDLTRVPFYGLGMNSDVHNRANVRLNRAYVEGATIIRPVKWLSLRFDGGWDDYLQKASHGPAPSIEQVFTPQTAPLLGDRPRYLRGEASAAVYWLASPGYSRTGGKYRFAYEEFNPRGPGATFGFIHTEIVQHIPIRRETWVVSLRARTDSIVRQSDVVPYFLMPAIGGGDSLRAYSTDRFRDRHAIVLTGELRWFPNRLGLDMALFFDAGKVAPLRSGLKLTEMRKDVGVGVRFHSPTSTALRLELAHGREGWRMVFTTSAPF